MAAQIFSYVDEVRWEKMSMIWSWWWWRKLDCFYTFSKIILCILLSNINYRYLRLLPLAWNKKMYLSWFSSFSAYGCYLMWVAVGVSWKFPDGDITLVLLSFSQVILSWFTTRVLWFDVLWWICTNIYLQFLHINFPRSLSVCDFSIYSIHSFD